VVSDGGSPFGPDADAGFLWRIQQYVSVLMEQVGALRKRWLISNFISGQMQGTYWGIGSTAEHYDASGGYTQDLVTDVVSAVRTDLDAFSGAEQAVLENHGYILADAAVQRYVRHLIAPDALPYRVPNPDWLDESRVRTALAGSSKRTLCG
jgi:NTE family protein